MAICVNCRVPLYKFKLKQFVIAKTVLQIHYFRLLVTYRGFVRFGIGQVFSMRDLHIITIFKGITDVLSISETLIDVLLN